MNTRRYETAFAGNGPRQVAVIAGDRVYVASRNDQAVNVLHARELRTIGEPIRVGVNPYAMAADQRHVWVTGLGDNTLARITDR